MLDEQMSAYGSYMTSMYSATATHDSNDTSSSKLVKGDGPAESAYTFAHGLGSPKKLTAPAPHYTTHDEILMEQRLQLEDRIPSPSFDGLQVTDGYVRLDMNKLAAQEGTGEGSYSEVKSPPLAHHQ
jgi:hypothetical protein